jgi:hypothetical protein
MAAWRSKLLAICEAFAADPPVLALPAALFVQRLDRNHSVIIRSKSSNKLGAPPDHFHALIVDRRSFAALHFDPFVLDGRFPPAWDASSDLPVLEWQGSAVPGRTVPGVQKVLKRSNGPELLGGCQALLDGSRLLFVRETASQDLIRDLWTLLPYSNRSELMPATFAWNKNLAFDIAVVPAERADQFIGYMTEEQAGGYPEGRYELSLQTAAEAGDQASLDILWARRSRREMWRLGILLLVVMSIMAAAMRILVPGLKL